MKRLLLILLTAFSAAAHTQQAPDGSQGDGYAGPFGERHVQEKRREQIAIGVRVRHNLRLASDRNEVQYAENRRRCQAALRVAELCGKFAGTFSCDDKGFKPITVDTGTRPIVMDNSARHKMERCALDAARRDP